MFKNLTISLLFSFMFMASTASAMNEKIIVTTNSDVTEKNWIHALLDYSDDQESIHKKQKLIKFLSWVQYRAQDTYNYPKYRDEAYRIWLYLDQANIKNDVPYTTKPTQEELEAQFEKAENDFEDYWEAEFVRFGCPRYRKSIENNNSQEKD